MSGVWIGSKDKPILGTKDASEVITDIKSKMKSHLDKPRDTLALKPAVLAFSGPERSSSGTASTSSSTNAGSRNVRGLKHLDWQRPLAAKFTNVNIGGKSGNRFVRLPPVGNMDSSNEIEGEADRTAISTGLVTFRGQKSDDYPHSKHDVGAGNPAQNVADDESLHYTHVGVDGRGLSSSPVKLQQQVARLYEDVKFNISDVIAEAGRKHHSPSTTANEGKDVSKTEKSPPKRISPLKKLSPPEKKGRHPPTIRSGFNEPLPNIPETRIPEEFHRRAGASYQFAFDQPVNSANSREYDLDERLWKTVVFPATRPGDRDQVFMLEETLQQILSKIERVPYPATKEPAESSEVVAEAKEGGEHILAVDAVQSFVKSLNQESFNLRSRIFPELKAWDVVFSELVRQTHVSCAERGLLLEKVRSRYIQFFEFLLSILDNVHTKQVEQKAVEVKESTLPAAESNTNNTSPHQSNVDEGALESGALRELRKQLREEKELNFKLQEELKHTKREVSEVKLKRKEAAVDAILQSDSSDVKSMLSSSKSDSTVASSFDLDLLKESMQYLSPVAKEEKEKFSPVPDLNKMTDQVQSFLDGLSSNTNKSHAIIRDVDSKAAKKPSAVQADGPSILDDLWSESGGNSPVQVTSPDDAIEKTEAEGIEHGDGENSTDEELDSDEAVIDDNLIEKTLLEIRESFVHDCEEEHDSTLVALNKSFTEKEHSVYVNEKQRVSVSGGDIQSTSVVSGNQKVSHLLAVNGQQRTETANHKMNEDQTVAASEQHKESIMDEVHTTSLENGKVEIIQKTLHLPVPLLNLQSFASTNKPEVGSEDMHKASIETTVNGTVALDQQNSASVDMQSTSKVEVLSQNVHGVSSANENAENSIHIVQEKIDAEGPPQSNDQKSVAIDSDDLTGKISRARITANEQSVKNVEEKNSLSKESEQLEEPSIVVNRTELAPVRDPSENTFTPVERVETVMLPKEGHVLREQLMAQEKMMNLQFKALKDQMHDVKRILDEGGSLITKDQLTQILSDIETQLGELEVEREGVRQSLHQIRPARIPAEEEVKRKNLEEHARNQLKVIESLRKDVRQAISGKPNYASSSGNKALDSLAGKYSQLKEVDERRRETQRAVEADVEKLRADATRLRKELLEEAEEGRMLRAELNRLQVKPVVDGRSLKSAPQEHPTRQKLRRELQERKEQHDRQRKSIEKELAKANQELEESGKDLVKAQQESLDSRAAAQKLRMKVAKQVKELEQKEQLIKKQIKRISTAPNRATTKSMLTVALVTNKGRKAFRHLVKIQQDKLAESQMNLASRLAVLQSAKKKVSPNILRRSVTLDDASHIFSRTLEKQNKAIAENISNTASTSTGQPAVSLVVPSGNARRRSFTTLPTKKVNATAEDALNGPAMVWEQQRGQLDNRVTEIMQQLSAVRTQSQRETLTKRLNTVMTSITKKGAFSNSPDPGSDSAKERASPNEDLDKKADLQSSRDGAVKKSKPKKVGKKGAFRQVVRRQLSKISPSPVNLLTSDAPPPPKMSSVGVQVMWEELVAEDLEMDLGLVLSRKNTKFGRLPNAARKREKDVVQLGDRVFEKGSKDFRIQNAHLAEVFARYAAAQGIENKSRSWLRRFISQVYTEKIVADAIDDRESNARATMPEFLFEYLKEKYGTRKLVDRTAAVVVSTLRTFRDEDATVEYFTRFLEESWDLRALNEYLRAYQIVDDGTAAGRAGRNISSVMEIKGISLEKCLEAANVVLGDRGEPAESAFVTRLWNNVATEKRKPSPAPESLTLPTQKRVVRSVSNVSGVSHASLEEEGDRIFDRELFLGCLIQEFAAMEEGFSKYVEDLFKQFDTDSDGFMLVKDFSAAAHSQGISREIFDWDSHWKEAHSASSQNTPIIDAIDLQGFKYLCGACPAFRQKFNQEFLPEILEERFDPEAALARSADAARSALDVQSSVLESVLSHWGRLLEVIGMPRSETEDENDSIFDLLSGGEQMHSLMRSRLVEFRGKLVEAADLSPRGRDKDLEDIGSKAFVVYRKLLDNLVAQMIHLHTVVSGVDNSGELNLAQVEKDLELLEDMGFRVFNSIKLRMRKVDNEVVSPQNS